MATITLTQNFSNLNRWPGNLLRADTGATILTHTATNFSFRLPSSGVDFPNYRVVVTGTGFTYDGSIATGGTVAKVQIFNAANQVVLTFGGIGLAAIASHFSQLYADMFGAVDSQTAGPGPNGFAAMSHLMSANDIINGTAGDDNQTLAGFDLGNDIYNMGAGDDQISGGVGRDTINGGDGYDRLTYRETNYELGDSGFRGVTINVDAGTVLDPWGSTDHFTSIESFEGSRFNDKFFGSLTQRDRFDGSRGADKIDGGDVSFDTLGNLTADNRDQVTYSNDYWDGGKRGIVVHLETSFVNGSITGKIIDGFGNTDTVIDIERVTGTRFNDVFVGSRVDNQFVGGEGKDSYDGGAGKGDAIGFWDWFTDSSPHGVVVNLSLAANQILDDGFGNTETAVRIENLYGGDTNDKLTGNAANNLLEGGDGNDTLSGLSGSDTFYFDGDYVFGDSDHILGFTATGVAKEHLAFNHGNVAGMTSTVQLVNGNQATSNVGTLIFTAADHTLYWDDDGTGGHAKVAVVVLDGVNALSADNIFLW